MASSWVLILLLKCFDFLSWPMLALGYPLCASIEAIESDSHSETRNLISYWILLSLIYLFEYAFHRLLQWFQYWHYMKLIIVFFLVMPDFGRSAYVYNRLIKPCIYMNPKAVISRFRSWKSIFAKKEDFIVQAEKYVTQNGTEALEKLVASKASRGRLLMEQKDIKGLEMIDKEEVPESKQANNTALDSLKSNESTSPTMAKTEKMEVETEHRTYPQICASENVQKKWTCGICQMTMPSESDFKSHLQGKKHKAAREAPNMKSELVSEKGWVKKNDDESIGEQEKILNTSSSATLEQQQICTSRRRGRRRRRRDSSTTPLESEIENGHLESEAWI